MSLFFSSDGRSFHTDGAGEMTFTGTKQQSRNVRKTYKTISRSSSFDCGRRPKTTWQTYDKSTHGIIRVSRFYEKQAHLLNAKQNDKKSNDVCNNWSNKGRSQKIF